MRVLLLTLPPGRELAGLKLFGPAGTQTAALFDLVSGRLCALEEAGIGVRRVPCLPC